MAMANVAQFAPAHAQLVEEHLSWLGRADQERSRQCKLHERGGGGGGGGIQPHDSHRTSGSQVGVMKPKNNKKERKK